MNPNNQQRQNFCSFPFSSIFTMNDGEVKMCCDSKMVGKIKGQDFADIWNADLWQEVRRSFLKDERHEVCTKCWKREDQGLVSSRDPDERNYDLMNECTPEGVQKDLPKRLSIRLGNQCNLKCIMCGPSNSTKWFEDMDIYEKYNEDPVTRVRAPQVLNEEWLLQSTAGAEELLFLGGEPLLIQSHQKTLEHLIKIGRAPHVTLSYFTNATLINESLVQLWKNFRSIKIRCSVDGTGKVFEYVRHLAKWEKAAQTMIYLDQCDLPQFNFGISYVFMGVNGLELEKLFQWRNSIKWKNAFPVIRPDYMTEPIFFPAHVLNKHDRDQISESLERILKDMTWHRHETELVSDMKAYLAADFSETEREVLQKKLFDYLSALDTRRGVNFRSALPITTLEAFTPAVAPLAQITP